MTTISQSMSTCVMTVSPEIAVQWLEKNYPGNRRVQQGRIALYQSVMERGEWTLSHQGIAFGVDGHLRDGQHRLWAIVKSGRTVDMMVSFNVPNDAYLVTDTGMAKSLSDRMELDRVRGKDMVATVRAAITGLGGVSTSYGVPEYDIRAFINRFSDDVHNVVSFQGKWIYYKAPVRGAVLRAWLNEDRNDVARFVNSLLDNGMNEAPIQQAMLLRDWQVRAGRSSSQTVSRSALYGVACRCIEAYLKGETLRKLYVPSVEVWTLPEVEA